MRATARERTPLTAAGTRLPHQPPSPLSKDELFLRPHVASDRHTMDPPIGGGTRGSPEGIRAHSQDALT